MFGWEWKSRGMEKVIFYKFTHTFLLKNNGQLKQKKLQTATPKKKKQSPNLLKKKSCLVKHTHKNEIK